MAIQAYRPLRQGKALQDPKVCAACAVAPVFSLDSVPEPSVWDSKWSGQVVRALAVCPALLSLIPGGGSTGGTTAKL